MRPNFLDASILATKYLGNQPYEVDCSEFVNKAAYNGDAIVSDHVVGEVVRKIREETRTKDLMSACMQELALDLPSLTLVPVPDEAFDCMNLLKNQVGIRGSISAVDLLHLATAIETPDCAGFVTLENDVLNQAAVIASISRERRKARDKFQDCRKLNVFHVKDIN